MKKKIIALLMVAAMAASFAACDSGDDSSTTTAANAVTTAAPAATTTTTRRQKTETSFKKKVESDYDVQNPGQYTLPLNLTADQVIEQLPSKLYVKVPGSYKGGDSQELFTAEFDSLDAFQEKWTYFDKDETVTIDGGTAQGIGGSPRFMTVVKDPAWASSESDYFVNYAVKATLTATHENDGNFGLIFRGTNLQGTGADNYFGMYIGIDEPAADDTDAGKTYINVGTSKNGTWKELTNTSIEHATETPYEVEVLVCNDKYIVYIDGTKVIDGDIDDEMPQGSAGFRSWNQSFEISDFSVRSLGAEDYAKFGDYYDIVMCDVTWSCFDYEPVKGKYGFFADAELNGKKVQAKALITIDPSAKPLTSAVVTTEAPVTDNGDE